MQRAQITQIFSSIFLEIKLKPNKFKTDVLEANWNFKNSKNHFIMKGDIT